MLITGEENDELSSTWMRYELAPLTADQSREGVRSQVWLALAGACSAGADGTQSMVKDRVADHGPSPQPLALTRQ